MTSAKHDSVDELELSARARRGGLGAAEQQTFERALEQSALLRAAHEAGRSFDAASVVRPGDEALIARAAALALETRAGPRRRSGWRWSLGLAAALLIGSAAAATAVVVVHHERALEVVRPPVTAVAPRPANVPAHRSQAHVPEPASAPATTASAGQPMEHVKTEPPPGGVGSSGSAVKPGMSAADLFRDAAAARRAGEFVAARALYTELQARFPGTREARVSQVSLGKLWLSAGKAREAERAFNAYLAGGGGDLGEEALVGRANALQVLGESVEERRAWQELLRKFPGSVYRSRAEARSASLDAARNSATE
jgi:hypothetical protein